jgi:uncharacterized protein YjlB
LADTIIAPSGQIVAQSLTQGDESSSAYCDLDWCDRYRKTLFDFEHYRMVEHYGLITERGVSAIPPAERPPCLTSG